MRKQPRQVHGPPHLMCVGVSVNKGLVEWGRGYKRVREQPRQVHGPPHLMCVGVFQ